jgi:gamma-glutamyltranspeptidase/glutathione hydrolase
MRPSSPQPVARAQDGCVVSYCPIASAIGAGVLRQGGNAMDAAVATSIALAVTFPQAGNLGGGGFMLYAPAAGSPQFLDYRETAPANVRPELFLRDGMRDEARSTHGALPVGTPGTVAGLSEALRRFGTWSWEKVVTPSIELARHGTWLTTRQARYLELYTEMFRPFSSTSRAFMPNGHTPLPGALFAQPELGHTLERLAIEGPRHFYEGELARKIAKTVAEHGGVLTERDLAVYEPVWRTPLERSFLGRRVIAPSLPSGGGVVLLASLGLFEAEGFGETALGSVERYLAYARVMRVAFALRGALIGDPEHLAPPTLAEARAIAERRYARGDLARLARELAHAPSPRVGNEQNTTHLCVLDPHGNAVSNTYSLNTIFGSKLVVDGGGFFLNNSLDDFSLADGAPNWYELSDGKENRIAPGKRPVSSMCPALFLFGPDAEPDKRGAAELVLGGSGGPRIPSLIFQIAQAALGDGLTIEDAVRQPRVHHQHRPDELVAEEAIGDLKSAALAAAVLAADENGVPSVAARYAETPLLGIAAGLRVGGPLPPGNPRLPAVSSPAGATLERRDALSAVLDSRFMLV